MADYGDNNPVYGSQLITVGMVTYVAKNIKVKKYAADRKTSTDQVGNENKQWFTSKIPDGTLTLQFPSSATPAPAQYTIITLTSVGVTEPINFILFDVGETYEAGGETLADCMISKQMGS